MLASSFSISFAFTPQRNTPFDVRAEGMGGSHFTDSESFYTLFSNPAGLAFADEKVLWPVILAESGSIAPETLTLFWKLSLETLTISFLNPSYYTNFEDSALGTFTIGDFDFRVKQRLVGPLTFGSIKNNFGWGLLSTMYIEVDGTSFASAIWDAAVSYDFVVGYSIPIDFGSFGKLAFGFSGRGITQLQASWKIETLAAEETSSDVLPTELVLGFGFDVGVQYNMLNLINIAIVWHDAYSPVWVKEILFEDNNLEFGYNIRSNSSFRHSKLDPTLGIGIGLDIPLELITGNFISHFGIHADYSDLLVLFKDNFLPHNRLSEFSTGMELVFLDKLALRLGMTHLDPSVGLGIYLGNFKMDFSLFTEDMDSGSPLWGTGISMAIRY